MSPELPRAGPGDVEALSSLHNAAIDELRGLSSEYDCWVLADNRLARGFYERRGWRLDGESESSRSRRTRSTSGTRRA